MQIRIDLKKMRHLRDESCYNHNYYAYGNQGQKLLQVGNEDGGTYDYYLIDGRNKICIGSSEDNDEESVDFMTRYT